MPTFNREERYDPVFSRTSVTIDEAVAILFGWQSGPILFYPLEENPSQEMVDAGDGLLYSLMDDLYDHRDSIDEFPKVLEKAKAFLCDINDEINKGENSALRIDQKLSNDVFTFITLTSLNEWKKSRYGNLVIDPVDSTPTSVLPTVQTPAEPPRMRAQETAILTELEKLGYSPKSLPRNDDGKSGAKAKAKTALAQDPLFAAKTAFKRAWDQLRADGLIADAP